jgi:hypothetical protein
MIEGSALNVELKLLRQRITLISDRERQAEALQTFKELCNVLGISDMELVQS